MDYIPQSIWLQLKLNDENVDVNKIESQNNFNFNFYEYYEPYIHEWSLNLLKSDNSNSNFIANNTKPQSNYMNVKNIKT